MSSSIKDFSSIRDLEMSGFKKQVARERRDLEEVHQKNKAAIKAAQEQEIVELRDDHAHKINEAYERREKVLTDLERNLTQTKDITEKQLSTIKSRTKEKEEQIAADYAQRRIYLNTSNEQQLQETNYKFNNQLKKIHAEGEGRIQETKEDLTVKHNQIKDQFENKMNQTKSEYQSQLNRQDQDFDKVKKLKLGEYKEKEISMREAHENKLVEQSKNNQELYQQRGTDFRKKFQEQDSLFENRFKNQISTHHSQLKGLDQKLEKYSQQMKQDLMTKMEAVKNKEDDIFFEFTEIDSSLKDQGDHYLVEVKIPEYAKKDIRLTTNNKEIMLTLNRRYQDQVEKDGVKHKVNKVETLSSRLATTEHLNPKKISSQYSDGIMSYKIQKA